MNTNQRIEQALVDLINLVRSVESDEGEPCGSMECDVDVTTKSGKVETWTVTVMRRAHDEDDGESIAYRRGRMARARGSFRVLANPADDQERDDWLRGWDDEDSEIRWAERLLQRRKEGR